MSYSLNKVILVGRLGADPELRQLDGGRARCRFNVATNRRWTDRQGQQREDVQWHRVVAWSKLADLCSSYLTKGRMVCVEGRLRRFRYTDRQGVERHMTEVVADTAIFLDRASSSVQAHPPAPPPPPAPPSEQLDDLPF